MPRFGPVVTAMVTPFTEDGALDLDGAASWPAIWPTPGTDGLVVAGTTGEGPVLSDDERLDLWRAVAEAVDRAGHRLHRDQRHRPFDGPDQGGRAAAGWRACWRSRRTTTVRLRPGLAAHFRAMAAATDLPVVLYDIPVRTGRRIGAWPDPRAGQRRAQHRRPSRTPPATRPRPPCVAESPAGFEVYCGDDSLTLPFLAVGAVGVVSVAVHWAGPVFADMVVGLRRRETSTEARRSNQRLFESYRFESTEEYPNPVPAKAACRALGPAGRAVPVPAPTLEPAPSVCLDRPTPALSSTRAREDLEPGAPVGLA